MWQFGWHKNIFFISIVSHISIFRSSLNGNEHFGIISKG